MRTLIDLEDKLIRELDEMARKKKSSRAALIRKAVADFLAQSHSAAEAEAFGAWGTRKIDGVEFQRKMRSEW